MEPNIRKNLITRYLLGDLPDAEQLALEQEIFADDEQFEHVWAVENELVDRYVRGRLAPAEKALFEKHYLASPVHRERVSFAQTLLQAADSESERAGLKTASATPWWNSFFTFQRSYPASPVTYWVTAAAMLLLAAGGIWLAIESKHWREQVSRLEDESVAQRQRQTDLEKEIAAERERNDQLAAEIERLRDAQTPPDGGPSSENSPSKPLKSPTVISVLLSSLLMRGGGEPPQVNITKEANLILLQIGVEEAAGRTFQANLRTVSGTEVWSRSNIKARAHGNKSFLVTIPVPASKLATGDYILALAAREGSGEFHEINRYYFKVNKP